MRSSLIPLLLCSAPFVQACHQDVGGVYGTTWEDSLSVKLAGIGADQVVTASGDEVVTFTGPTGESLELDLSAYCGESDVACPEEVWPASVKLEETFEDEDQSSGQDEHAMVASDADASGTEMDGEVDHESGAFGFLLQAVATVGEAGAADCAALKLSVSGGTFDIPDGEDIPSGIKDGEVLVGWAGACAGWTIAGAVLTIRQNYTAERTGDVD